MLGHVPSGRDVATRRLVSSRVEFLLMASGAQLTAESDRRIRAFSRWTALVLAISLAAEATPTAQINWIPSDVDSEKIELDSPESATSHKLSNQPANASRNSSLISIVTPLPRTSSTLISTGAARKHHARLENSTTSSKFTNPPPPTPTSRNIAAAGSPPKKFEATPNAQNSPATL
jgi:hypothetical protein